LAGKWNDVISLTDVTRCAGLCALATFDREELKTHVIENSKFKAFLDLVPSVRDAITSFFASSYAQCMAMLESMRPDLTLDLHLHPHVNTLLSQIRNRALAQYFSPFVSVNLSNMAAAFGVGDVAAMEREVSILIAEGRIHARVDSHAKVLYARRANVRKATFKKALGLGDKYVRDTKALILRLTLTRNDIVVKQSGGSNVFGHRSGKGVSENTTGGGAHGGVADAMQTDL
jgi:COP9 signalosome complex subunit 1